MVNFAAILFSFKHFPVGEKIVIRPSIYKTYLDWYIACNNDLHHVDTIEFDGWLTINLSIDITHKNIYSVHIYILQDLGY